MFEDFAEKQYRIIGLNFLRTGLIILILFLFLCFVFPSSDILRIITLFVIFLSVVLIIYSILIISKTLANPIIKANSGTINYLNNAFSIIKDFNKQGIFLLGNGIFHRGIYSLKFIPKNELLWIYKAITKIYVNLMHDRDVYSFIIIGKNNKMKIEFAKVFVDEVLINIYNIYNDIFFGYSSFLMKLYKINVNYLCYLLDYNKNNTNLNNYGIVIKDDEFECECNCGAILALSKKEVETGSYDCLECNKPYYLYQINKLIQV